MQTPWWQYNMIWLQAPIMHRSHLCPPRRRPWLVWGCWRCRTSWRRRCWWRGPAPPPRTSPRSHRTCCRSHSQPDDKKYLFSLVKYHVRMYDRVWKRRCGILYSTQMSYICWLSDFEVLHIRKRLWQSESVLDPRPPHLGNFEFYLVGEDGRERLRGPGEVEVSQVVVQCGGGEDQGGGTTCRI